MKKASGFTLIELLVVVAIIAILSGTILVALNSARAKAKDARIQSQLQQIKAQAELYYTNHGNAYSTYWSTFTGNTESLCGTAGYGVFDATDPDSSFRLLKDAVYEYDGQWNGGAGWCFLGAGGGSWMALAALHSGGYWCVDSNGSSKNFTGNPWSITYTGGQISCP